jgi:hypothetical protein
VSKRALLRRCPTSSTGCCAGCGCPMFRRSAPEVIATAASQRWEHAHVLVTDDTDSYRHTQATAGKGVMPLA